MPEAIQPQRVVVVLISLFVSIITKNSHLITVLGSERASWRELSLWSMSRRYELKKS
jgi:hypothetical protein